MHICMGGCLCVSAGAREARQILQTGVTGSCEPPNVQAWAVKAESSSQPPKIVS